MKRKQKFDKPELQVIELQQELQLLTSSKPDDPYSAPLNAEGASIDDYGDGEFSW